MPLSIPEPTMRSRSSLLVVWTRISSVVRPSTSVKVTMFSGSSSGDLAELAVEGDLELALGDHHVAP
jgi:hypothetical protein